jgi:hypothetical protein
MTKSTRRYPTQYLSPEASSEIVRALGTHQGAHSLDDYELAAIAGVSRDTVGRWRREPAALPARTLARLLAGIEEHAEAAGATRSELIRLLTAAQQSLAAAERTPVERLRRRLNERGLRGNAVVAEIAAIGLQVTPKESE